MREPSTQVIRCAGKNEKHRWDLFATSDIIYPQSSATLIMQALFHLIGWALAAGIYAQIDKSEV